MSSPPASKEGFPLPPGFHCVQDVLDGKLPPGRMINLVGSVKDHRCPIATTRTDHKSTLKLYDLSTDEAGDHIELNIFRPLATMPDVGLGDVLFLHAVKVQLFRDSLSLITNISTSIRIYDAHQIPQPPTPATCALKPIKGMVNWASVQAAEKYISWMHRKINKSALPSEEVFKTRVEQSRNVKAKSCLLKDVADANFYDIVVQLVKEPFDFGDRMTLWVSDYTENPEFFHMERNDADSQDAEDAESIDNDQVNTQSTSQSGGFTGPFGKYCLQVTCYEPHTDSIRSKVGKGDWVRFRNIHVKTGRNGENLEGFLRAPREATRNSSQVDILDTDFLGSELKGAISRKIKYEEGRGKQMRRAGHKEACGEKRKQLPEARNGKNSKQRRMEERAKERALRQKKAVARNEETRVETKPDARETPGGTTLVALNELVCCDNRQRRRSDLETILRRPMHHGKADCRAIDMKLPFTCANFRAHVRVVSFYPPALEDFACPRNVTEYNAPPDSSPSASEGVGKVIDPGDGKVWEWRFALHLEEAAENRSETTRQSLWVVIDHSEAHHLLGLDACDLRADSQALNRLRAKLSALWGNLEEVKAAADGTKRRQKSEQRANRNSSGQPADSSDVEDGDNTTETAENVTERLQLSNRPFSCCIRQYGVKVDEPNERKADAGKGKRWERMYGMFGVKLTKRETDQQL